jgi:hypothetical protein
MHVSPHDAKPMLPAVKSVKMRITPITVEWNSYNGLIIELLHIDAGKLDNSLFGINCSKTFLYVDVFFLSLKIFDKTGL